MPGKVYAISGCTNSGKTTLAQQFARFIGEEKTWIIHQDDFYYGPEKVEKLYITRDGVDVTEHGFFYSYDEKESVDVEGFRIAILNASEKYENVIVEGNMLTEMDTVLELFDKIFVMTLDFKTCKSRRETRKYDPPDDVGYFEYVAWPAYKRHLSRALRMARDDDRFSIIDVCNPRGETIDESIDLILRSLMNDHIRITNHKLRVEEVRELALDDSCGAISLFIGCTRDNFEGKSVQRLSYDCYDEMTYKEMRRICAKIREEMSGVTKMVIFHRLGDVPVGEASVIIASSSPHREESIRATEMAINTLKKIVPIWKKEVYKDDEHQWKRNQESITDEI